MMKPATKTVLLNNGRFADVPVDFICPITNTIMTQPLMTRDGHRFERKAIIARIQEVGTCPLTGRALSPRGLIPDKALEQRIEFWCQNNNIDDGRRQTSSASHSGLDFACFSATDASTYRERCCTQIDVASANRSNNSFLMI